MHRAFRWSLAGLFLAALPAWSASPKFSIRTVEAAPPKELKEPIRKLLGGQSIQLLNGQGKVLCQVWFCKEVPAAELKASPTYRDLKETTVIGAIQYQMAATDYRSQKIKPGVYTLRLGFQPMDGDHMGVSPSPDFLLLVPAKRDNSPQPLQPKALYERSSRSVGTSHPGVLMLSPNEKPADKPQLVATDASHWALNVKEPIAAGGKKGALGISVTLVGSAE